MAAAVLALACAAAACSGDAAAPAAAESGGPDFPFGVEITGIEIVLSDATYDLALPIDVTVDRNGRVYIMDRRARHIVVVGQENEVEGTIGRNGEGPQANSGC